MRIQLIEDGDVVILVSIGRTVGGAVNELEGSWLPRVIDQGGPRVQRVPKGAELIIPQTGIEREILEHLKLVLGKKANGIGRLFRVEIGFRRGNVGILLVELEVRTHFGADGDAVFFEKRLGDLRQAADGLGLGEILI